MKASAEIVRVTALEVGLGTVSKREVPSAIKSTHVLNKNSLADRQLPTFVISIELKYTGNIDANSSS
jgi:hypothetical protein